MTNYYLRDGRYFGEDTSFYEFDTDCLKKRGEGLHMAEQTDFSYECDTGACEAEKQPDPPEDFDRLFSSRKLDMLKTAIPFLPYRQQKAFACAVKLVEFHNLIRYFDQNRTSLLGACSGEEDGIRMADMLDAMRGYCSPSEQEQLDSLFQVLMTIQFIREET